MFLASTELSPLFIELPSPHGSIYDSAPGLIQNLSSSEKSCDEDAVYGTWMLCLLPASADKCFRSFVSNELRLNFTRGWLISLIPSGSDETRRRVFSGIGFASSMVAYGTALHRILVSSFSNSPQLRLRSSIGLQLFLHE